MKKCKPRLAFHNTEKNGDDWMCTVIHLLGSVADRTIRFCSDAGDFTIVLNPLKSSKNYVGFKITAHKKRRGGGIEGGEKG